MCQTEQILTTAQSSLGRSLPSWETSYVGFLCPWCALILSSTDIRELEKSFVTMVRNENADIKQKQDTARLPIHHCQLVLINTHPPTVLPSDIKDSPLTQVLMKPQFVSSLAWGDVVQDTAQVL